MDLKLINVNIYISKILIQTLNKTTNVLTVDSTTVGTNVSAGGSLVVGTTSELKGNVGINSNLLVTGSATLKSGVDIGGNLGVTGNTTTTGY